MKLKQNSNGLWRPDRFVLAEIRQIQNCLKTVSKLFYFSSVSVSFQVRGQFYVHSPLQQ